MTAGEAHPVSPWGSGSQRISDARTLDRTIAVFNLAAVGAVVLYAVVQAARGEGLHLGPGSVSAQARDVFWFALLCGFASFAVLESAKRLLGLRARYQSEYTERWLAERYGKAKTTKERKLPYDELCAAVGAAGEDVPRIFDLPTEQCAGQISTVTDVALGGRGNDALLDALAGGDDAREDLRPDDRRFAREQAVRAGIDQLQIALGEGWRRSVQGAALWISGAFGVGLVHAANMPDRAEPRYVLAALLIGGPLAWIFRDLSALVERARR